MITRIKEAAIVQALDQFPVVGIVGARQVGKTTLARIIADRLFQGGIYLDLERPSDLNKLREPELYLNTHKDKLVVLDEIHRRPDLFPVLRTLIDEDRRPGRFIVLGSASPELMRQSSESLAGRIAYIELSPFCVEEMSDHDDAVLRKLWVRGGFPGGFLAKTDTASFAWRNAFVRTYLERDIPGLGLRITPSALGRLWQIMAHFHGQLWNASSIAASLGVSSQTVRNHLDVLSETFVVRSLQPYHANLKKRLVKSPKVYIRDSGILHALLGIEDFESLSGHPSLGASWEGWVVEQIAAIIPSHWRMWFYRTSGGAEIDLLIERSVGLSPIAVEIKYSASPTPGKGFWQGMEDLDINCGYVVCPTGESYPLDKRVRTLPVRDLSDILR